ncbi:DUF4190 domain-containing protein [Streptomyces bathyalis]|uniref:DUF4190 domain-containing protein n=1 Tax=Streptomyces bathyalis TaxID=2710756 RepID=UPI001FE8753A|nr:DUF4190 domain-containing protein [Streptomyces bathyalis]
MNAMNTLDRPGHHDRGDEQPPPERRRWSAVVREADSMAVAAFVLGLVGLLVFNAVLGPCALVLGSLALLRNTRRRLRAVLGITLGAADLIVLATVAGADQTFIWGVG